MAIESTARQRQQAHRLTFTDLGIRRLKPPQQGQELIWDAAQTGLGLLVSAGGTKTFRSQFKLNGKWLTRSIGRYGEMSPERGKNINIATAREIARRDRALALQGIDPRQPKAEAVATACYGAVVDQFIELYAKPRQRSWKETERTLQVNCKAWQDKPMRDISKSDAYNLLDKIIAAGHGPKARLTLAWLKTLWRWAWRRDIVPTPLMDQVTIETERKHRERVYTDAELKAIWLAADKLDSYKAAFIKLLVLLAPRKTALAQMRRAHLDSVSEPTLWVTPFELTKSRKTMSKKRVYQTPLPPLAQRILKGLKGREQGEDFVFPGRVKDRPIDPGSPLQRLVVRHGAPEDFNYHALRHTCATWLQNAGHSEYEIGLVLNHSSTTVTAGYSHGHALDLKRKLLGEWADHVEKQVAADGVALLR